MNTRDKIILSALAVAVLAGGSWIATSAMTGTNATDQVDVVQDYGEGPLDGMIFVGAVGPDGKTLDVADTFVFANGTFVSKECEIRCKYPARPYFVRASEGVTEFVSETKCPYKNAWITWRGRYEDGKISGVATWRLERWYWTVERKIAFAGELADQSKPLASNR